MNGPNKNMATFAEVADKVFVRELVIRGVSHREISDYYQSQNPYIQGLKENGRLEFIFYITTGNHKNSLDL